MTAERIAKEYLPDDFWEGHDGSCYTCCPSHEHIDTGLGCVHTRERRKDSKLGKETDMECLPLRHLHTKYSCQVCD